MKEEKLAWIALWGCFLAWGVFPIFVAELLKLISPVELLLVRIIFAALLMSLFFLLRRALTANLREIFRGKFFLASVITSLILAANWFFYIYSVEIGQSNQACLGYFITPLINIALGRFFFAEKLDAWKITAIVFALSAVIFQTVMLGSFPYLALAIGGSFGIYGAVRKYLKVSALKGLFAEMLFLSVISLPISLYFYAGKWANLGNSFITLIWFFAAGIFTLLPLLWYLFAVQKLPLNSVGLAQYSSPSLQFLVAIFYLQEDFDLNRLIAFILVWIGLFIYSFHLFYEYRK